ncbi:MAG: hypothetical protein AAGC71_03595 [Pseudomonadota bacterium]
MSRTALIIGIAFLLAAAVVTAQSVTEQHIEVIADDTAPVKVIINGEAVDLSNVTVDGDETRTIVTEDGREIVVDRSNGLSVTIDGEAIAIPDLAELQTLTEAAVEARVMVLGDDVTVGEPSNSVTLIAGRELDPTEREALRAAILATGLVEKVKMLPDDVLTQANVRVLHRDASE